MQNAECRTPCSRVDYLPLHTTYCLHGCLSVRDDAAAAAASSRTLFEAVRGLEMKEGKEGKDRAAWADRDGNKGVCRYGIAWRGMARVHRHGT